MYTIINSRGAPIRGLLGPWDAFAHWRALGLSLLAWHLRPPLSAFTSSFRHQESAGFEDLKLKVYFRGCAGSTRQKRFGSDLANLSQYGRLKHARTHARVCEGTRNSKGAGSTAAAAFANPDASPESTPTRRSPDPAAAPRGADDALPSPTFPLTLTRLEGRREAAII